MLRLIFAFVDIMLHRRGPEDLPSSQFLVWLLLAASLGLDLTVTLWNGGSGRIVAVSVLVVALNVWFVWALLRTFNRVPRFRQTMAAVLGADVLLSLLHAPVIPFIELPENPEEATLTIPMLLTTVVFVWAIDINAFVFSRALERPYFLCLAIVIGYALLIFSLQATLLQPVS